MRNTGRGTGVSKYKWGKIPLGTFTLPPPRRAEKDSNAAGKGIDRGFRERKLPRPLERGSGHTCSRFDLYPLPRGKEKYRPGLLMGTETVNGLGLVFVPSGDSQREY